MAFAAPQPRVIADIVPVAWVRNVVLVVGGAAFVAAILTAPVTVAPGPLL